MNNLKQLIDAFPSGNGLVQIDGHGQIYEDGMVTTLEKVIHFTRKGACISIEFKDKYGKWLYVTPAGVSGYINNQYTANIPLKKVYGLLK